MRRKIIYQTFVIEVLQINVNQKQGAGQQFLSRLGIVFVNGFLELHLTRRAAACLAKIIYKFSFKNSIYKYAIYIQLFQLRLSPSKAEKSNTSAKGLLGIAKKSFIMCYLKHAYMSVLSYLKCTSILVMIKNEYKYFE